MGLRERLSGLRERRFQVYFHMFVVHIYYPMRKIYNQRYAEVQPQETKTTTTTTSLEMGDHEGTDRQTVARSPSDGNVEWQWQDLPDLWPAMTRYRWASTVWMAYVVIKYTVPGILEWTIDLMGLGKPANCYLLGRFQLADEVEHASALLFALYHLIWRYFQLYKYNPMNISSIYFLILDDRDISQYYKLLAEQTRVAGTAARDELPSPARYRGLFKDIARSAPERASSVTNDLSGPQPPPPPPPPRPFSVESRGRERFMHEVMSYSVTRGSERINRLRPNRTLEACRSLRSFMIKTNIIGLLIFIPVALGITGALMLQIFNDKRYLGEYRACNQQLAQMDKRGELTTWSLHFTGHQQLAFLADFIENYFLWCESGIVVFFSPLLIMTINRDLVVYWEHLHAQIETLLSALRERRSQLVTPRKQFEEIHNYGRACHQPFVSRARRSSARTRNEFEDNLEELVQDVQFGFRDFINQIRHADSIVGELTSMLLTVWFSLFALFTYTQQTQLLPALKATLICVGLVLTALYLSILRLHQCCLKSYPKICSLMTLDTSEHKYRFNALLDYYVTKRTCYTFYRQVPMTGIQYLTYVGWSLSCLFLVLNRR